MSEKNQTAMDAGYLPTLTGTLTSLLRADFAVLVQNRRSLIIAMMLPLFILLTSKRAAVSGNAMLLSVSITFGLVSIAILGYSLSVARDREKGIFQRLRVTPAPPWTIMTSRLAVQVGACLTMAAAVLIAGAVVNGIALSPAGYALTAMVTLVGAAMFLSIGQALVGLIRSAETVSAVGRLVYIGLVLFGLLGESGRLGSTLETAAVWSPYGTIAALMTGGMDTASWTGDTWLALAASLGYAAVFAGIGIKWFRWNAG